MTVEIIAEIANAHQGEPDQALELAKRAFDAGADAVKFHIYYAPEFLVRRHPRYEHFKNQSFAPDVWRSLIGEAQAWGPIYCDVFGIDAVATGVEHDIAGMKVHSSDTTNLPLIEAVARYGREKHGRRVYLSAGGATARELADAVNVLSAAGVRPILLHGFQSYPTALEDTELCRLEWLREHFGQHCDVGYMDHVAGDDPFAFALPLMAVARGATVIEKHITLNRAQEGVDYFSSIDVDELPRFIETVRRAESALGAKPEDFPPSERHYRDTVKKHWVSASALSKGHIIQASDLIMKRVPDALAGAVEMDKLVGRALLQDVEEEHAFTRADVAQIVWALPVARSASSRLSNKALLDMAGQPALTHLLKRLKRIERIDHVVMCTTTQSDDDAIADLAQQEGVTCYRGPVDDVLGRMLGAIEGHDVDVVLRVTGDDILIDRDYVGRAIDHHLRENAEYTDCKQLPSGTEVEVFDAELLRQIHTLSYDPDGTEYLTFFVTDNADQIRTTSLPVDDKHARDYRLTLDTSEDYEVIRRLLEYQAEQGKALDYDLDDIMEYFDRHPDVLKINAGVRQRQTPPSVNTSMDWQRLLR